MELLDAKRCVLVAIDLQGKLVENVWRAKGVIAGATRLVQMAGLFGVPVVLTEQYPKGLGPTHPEIRAAFDGLSGARRFVEKTSFGCMGEPRFGEALDAVRPTAGGRRRQIVVAGIESHICVMATVIELLASGDQVHVCFDAVSSRQEEHRNRALERMGSAGAVLTNHESVGFEWARDKDHPQFKPLSALVRYPLPSE